MLKRNINRFFRLHPDLRDRKLEVQFIKAIDRRVDQIDLDGVQSLRFLRFFLTALFDHHRLFRFFRQLRPGTIFHDHSEVNCRCGKENQDDSQAAGQQHRRFILHFSHK